MKKKSKVSKLSVPKLKVPQRVRNIHLPKLPLPGRKEREADTKLVQAIQNLPRITNETVAEHREEVLRGARKYIYPLSHSKRRVVVVTVTLLVVAVIGFFAYCVTSLYKLQSTSTFIYGVTQVVPFPVAKAGSSWVSYESYLFELRHTMHYYQTQQGEDFTTATGKAHLAKLKRDALNQVIQDAYVKQLAKQHGVAVSNAEITNQLALVREQNRLGSNDQVFRNVLSEFWGWTTDDFERELKQQLLAQKVADKLDTATQARASYVLQQLDNGGDFATLAKQYSDEASTKAAGGSYGIQIDANDHNLAPQVISALFKLQTGQHTAIIDTGFSLEIDQVSQITGDKLTAAHIVFKLQPITTYVKPLQAKNPSHDYIKLDK